MKKVWFGVIVIIAFVSGYYLHRPNTIVKTEQVKVYDFTQEPDKMQLYANTMGKVLIDKDEFERLEEDIRQKEMDLKFRQLSIWEEGYKEGFRK